MKNKTDQTISTLAAEGTRLDLAIAEARGLVTVTRLAPKRAPKARRAALKTGPLLWEQRFG